MSLAALFTLCRFVHFAALMLMFGVGLFAGILSPQRLVPRLSCDLQPLLNASVWATALTAILTLALQAGLMGEGWDDIWRLGTWWAVLGTTFGEVWRWHLGISLLALFTLWLPGTKRIRYIVGFSLLLLASMAFTGHTALHQGALGALHRFNHALHLLAAGYWFGCLLPLLVCLRYLSQPRWRRYAVVALIRFSRWGHLAVALVLITGVTNSLIILGQWPLRADSPYQRLLRLKILLVALMVVIALTNRYVVVPAMRRTPKLAQQGVLMACGLEFVLGAVVLVVVTIFAGYAPQ